MSTTIERFVAAGPWPQRLGLRVLVAIAGRPRGERLLARAPMLAQAAGAVLALGRYDRADVAGSLGWDPTAVVERGRELRRAEGRP